MRIQSWAAIYFVLLFFCKGNVFGQTDSTGKSYKEWSDTALIKERLRFPAFSVLTKGERKIGLRNSWVKNNVFGKPDLLKDIEGYNRNYNLFLTGYYSGLALFVASIPVGRYTNNGVRLGMVAAGVGVGLVGVNFGINAKNYQLDFVWKYNTEKIQEFIGTK